MPSLYDYPAYYDIVMNRSDAVVRREVATLTDIFARHGIAPQSETGSVLELACGACPHGIRLAQSGYRITGIDQSSAMLAEARHRAALNRVDITTVQADVIDFNVSGRPFDVALFMFETFPLITAETEIRRHLAAVRRHLRQGGIYVIDIDAGLCVHTDAHGEWGRRTVALPNGQLTIWHIDFPGDWIEGINRLTLFCRIETDEEVISTEDAWAIRRYNPWIIRLLADTLDGWRLDGCYAWDTGQDVQQDTAHYFCVFVAE